MEMFGLIKRCMPRSQYPCGVIAGPGAGGARLRIRTATGIALFLGWIACLEDLERKFDENAKRAAGAML